MSNNTLREITQAKELTLAVEKIKRPEAGAAPAIVCHIGGGALRFASAIFPQANADSIFARCEEREPEGKGAHFDVHQDLIDPVYPWLGVYNFAGVNDVIALELPDDLVQVYETRYPETSPEAYLARRNLASIALQSKRSDIFEGVLREGGGFVLPQMPHQHVVHDITPQDIDGAGSYMKLVVSGRSANARKDLESAGFQSLDELVTQELEPKEIDLGSVSPPPSMTRGNTSTQKSGGVLLD